MVDVDISRTVESDFLGIWEFGWITTSCYKVCEDRIALLDRGRQRAVLDGALVDRRAKDTKGRGR